MSYPSFKIHSCNENVANVSFVDIDYSSSNFNSIPTITATTDTDVNVFISDITLSSARLNFSAKFTGNVKYTVIAFT
tara:strand:+ start:373 stop:603 length:231 start_codon:yes stop_codon:yes gene_type:complete